MTVVRDVVRIAESTDAPRLVEMGKRFLEETAYADGRIEADSAHIETLIELVLTEGRGFVAVHDDEIVGMFGVVVIHHPLLNRRVGSEVVWWVEPEYRNSRIGVKLLRAAESWVAERGADRMQMTGYRDDGLGQLYERLGYWPCEVVYEKLLADPSVEG